MNSQNLQFFIDLVTFDQQLTELEQAVETINSEINQIKEKVASTQLLLDQKSAKKKELKKELDSQELTVKSLQEKESHQVSIVEKAANSKEYDAGSKELDIIRSQRDSQEQLLIRLLNEYERFEKNLESELEQEQAKIVELQDSISAKQESLKEHQSKLTSLTEQRSAKLAHVPDDWISRYNNMRGRVNDPVVPVDQDSCSACFYLISSKDLQFLATGDLVQCKDCYRFLYKQTESEDS